MLLFAEPRRSFIEVGMTGFGAFSGRENGEDVGRQQHQVDDAGQQVRPSSAVSDDSDDETKSHQHGRACRYSQLQRLSNPERGDSNHGTESPMEATALPSARLMLAWSYP